MGTPFPQSGRNLILIFLGDEVVKTSMHLSQQHRIELSVSAITMFHVKKAGQHMLKTRGI
ncbi:MAG: hypothetical protein WB795_24110 [Candidatus Acidiferrales bacterium]